MSTTCTQKKKRRFHAHTHTRRHVKEQRRQRKQNFRVLTTTTTTNSPLEWVRVCTCVNRKSWANASVCNMSQQLLLSSIESANQTNGTTLERTCEEESKGISNKQQQIVQPQQQQRAGHLLRLLGLLFQALLLALATPWRHLKHNEQNDADDDSRLRNCRASPEPPGICQLATTTPSTCNER